MIVRGYSHNSWSRLESWIFSNSDTHQGSLLVTNITCDFYVDEIIYDYLSRYVASVDTNYRYHEKILRSKKQNRFHTRKVETIEIHIAIWNSLSLTGALNHDPSFQQKLEFIPNGERSLIRVNATYERTTIMFHMPG